MSILYDIRSGDLIKSKLYNNGLILKNSIIIDNEIRTLFAEDKQGIWLDPSDLSTMFKDAVGTMPVTRDGDLVGLIKDKSGNNNHATQTISAAKPTYRTDGFLHWLEFDGVDDWLLVPNQSWLNTTGHKATWITAYKAVNTQGYVYHNSVVPTDYAQNGILFTDNTTYIRTGAVDGYPYNRDNISKVVTHAYDISKLLSTAYLNNVSLTGKFALGELSATITIGCRTPESPKVFAGMRFYGMLVVNEFIDDDRNEKSRQYLATKSGVTL